MTSQEINDWINEVWVTNLETYSGAVSIFDALGGGPLTPTASNPIWSDRNSFGGSANIVSSGFGLYGDSNQVTCKIPVGSYELDGFARAVARQAMANSSFTDLPTTFGVPSRSAADRPGRAAGPGVVSTSSGGVTVTAPRAH